MTNGSGGRRLLAVVVLVFLVVACEDRPSPTCDDEPADGERPIKIFLLGGQSNMAGRGQAKDLTPPYDTPFCKTRIWSPTSRDWVPLTPDARDSKGRFGPEISFGREIVAVLPNQDVRMVKFAVDGSALHDDWAPTRGEHYRAFMGPVKAALAGFDAKSMKYEVAGMLWLQGESDAAESKGHEYERNLTVFIAHMRQSFETPDMPFVIARPLEHFGRKTGQASLVRRAQQKVAKETRRVSWVDTDGLPMFNDGHYGSAGLIEIGKRFAAGYKETISESEPKR